MAIATTAVNPTRFQALYSSILNKAVATFQHGMAMEDGRWLIAARLRRRWPHLRLAGPRGRLP